jgi:hypothetical protein
MHWSWVMGLTNKFITFTILVPRPRRNWKCTTTTTTLIFSQGQCYPILNIYGLPDSVSRVNPQNQNDMRHLIDTFNCVEDCPIFTDMYDFCRMYAGGSLSGARKLCAGTTDVAINWAGGLHHAKRGEASGFCYVNDIVLAILELLRY